jgi:cytidine deaminase
MNSRPAALIALFGLPGAGKSTSALILRRLIDESGRKVAVVKIAAPLYDVQRQFYERAAAPLAEGRQDGTLLNFLGTHFRQMVPGFLLDDFATRCEFAALAGADAIICDDARPVDLPGLAAHGFTLVRVAAPDALRRSRKAVRDDVTRGQDDHPTEAGVEDAAADLEIVNAGDLSDLEIQLKALDAQCTELSAVRPDPTARKQLLDGLVDAARAAITPRYVENRHQIAAAIVAADGRIFTGLHLEAMVGRASICAEAVALGKACEAGATDLRLLVSVRHPKPTEPGSEVRVVPPCGLCRELLLDYGRELQVVVDGGGTLELQPMAELLPRKYVGTKWNRPAVAS